jgi:hypothetical protein
VYRLEDQDKILLADLEGSQIEYWDRGVDTKKKYTYFVTAVDTEGHEGNPAVITVQPNLNTIKHLRSLFRFHSLGNQN